MEQPIALKREHSVDSVEPTKHYSTRSSTQTSKSTKEAIPRLKPLAYTQLDLYNELKPPSKHNIFSVTTRDQGTIDFNMTEDHPFNRRGFKYKPCAPSPLFPSIMYSTTDLPPYAVRFSYFDRSQGSYLDDSLSIMASDQGWRSARTNVGIREGSYYVEFKIIQANDENSAGGHVRIGFGRKEASVEAPVGFDGYGYGLRDKTGQKLHLSRPVEFMKGGFKSGDVIGMLITLPSLEIQRRISDLQIKLKIKSNPLLDSENSKIKLDMTSSPTEHSNTDIIRDQIPIRYKNQLYFEQFEYTLTSPIEHLLNPVTVFGERAIPDKDKFKPAVLPDSKITVYKNGQLVGTAFEELLAFLPPSSELSQNPIISNLKKSKKTEDEFAVCPDDGTLGYYPMVSSYKNGCVQINPGPNFEYLPENLQKEVSNGKIKPLNNRYEEKIIEDTLYDIVDEIESQYLDALE